MTLFCPDPAYPYNQASIARSLNGEYSHCRPFVKFYGYQGVGGVEVSLDKIVELGELLQQALDSVGCVKEEVRKCLPEGCNVMLPWALCLLLLAALAFLGVWVQLRPLLQACRR